KISRYDMNPIMNVLIALYTTTKFLARILSLDTMGLYGTELSFNYVYYPAT
ncbi:hypothetical protein L9F63_006711, partial [Diploptera punctata]